MAKMRDPSEYWNQEAGERWAAGHERLEPILAPFGEALIDAADLPMSGCVVDVGCGCGATTIMAAEASPELEVVGIDISRPMLEVARTRPAPEGVRFEEADAGAAKLAPKSVDRIISRFGVMFFPEPTAAFANLHGWLAPGGRMAVLVWNPLPDNAWMAVPLSIVRRHVALEPPKEDVPGPFSLADPQRLEGILREAGFGTVEQRVLDLPMRVDGSMEDVLAFYLERGPVAAALEEASAPARDAVIEDLRTALTKRHDGSGVTMAAAARLVVAHGSP